MIFQKYSGAGNLFLVADNLQQQFSAESKNIIFLCEKAETDGLLLIEKSEQYSYKMRYFNRDGSESFCGNGARVLAFFAHQLGIISRDKKAIFEAEDGLHEAVFEEKYWGIQMKNVKKVDISFLPDLKGYFLDTGVDHFTVAVEDLKNYPVAQKGKFLRYHPIFSRGTNVNFFECKADQIFLRTYEQGVEAETAACGTGAAAVGLSLALTKQIPSPMVLHAKGGDLKLFFKQNELEFFDIWLFGPVEKLDFSIDFK